MISEHKVIVCKSQLYWHDEIIAGLSVPTQIGRIYKNPVAQPRPPNAALNCEHLLWGFSDQITRTDSLVFNEDDLAGDIDGKYYQNTKL